MVDWAKKNNGVPLIRVQKSNLYRDLLAGKNSTHQSWMPIPAFVRNPEGKKGILRRQCTEEYKIAPVEKKVKELYGLAPGKWMPSDTEFWIGVTIEEAKRISLPANKRTAKVYPFCNYISRRDGSLFHSFLPKNYARVDCVQWLIKNGFRVPPESSCIFCPYHPDAAWMDMKKNRPQEWKACVVLDRSLRKSRAAAIKGKVYLHESLTPLDQVKFKENQTQINFECEGVCHT